MTTVLHDRLPVTVLMGPTASGKTALACALYDQGGVELVSVDSALVYRGMDIGTAKPSAAELAQYPHHLIDLIDPEQVYSAAEFVTDVTALIHQIHARGNRPVLVGGTMLYFRSLLQGMATGLPEADASVRAAIEAEAAAEGWDAIHAQLAAVDPRAAQRFLPSDRQRVMRALEVYRLTGRPISALHDEQQPQTLPFDYQLYALMPERDVLHQRIALRLEQMWQAGFVDEVVELRKRVGLQADMPSMRAVGYRQVWEYLDAQARGEMTTQSHMQDKALFATRQLAKRQYTWLRSLREQHDIHLIKTVNEGNVVLRTKT
jgi:tRNA dimethylallyltransferase